MADAFGQDRRTHLEKMRKHLRAEAKALGVELDRLRATHQKRLQAVLKKLDQASDRVLLSELAAFRDELAAIRRGVGRLALSGRHAQNLKNEWNEWERHAGFDKADHEIRRERQEMIASELRLLGVALPASRPVESRAEAVVMLLDEAEDIEMPIAPVVEDAETEETTPTDWEAVAGYWDQLIGGLGPEYADEAQLSRLLKAYRVMQAERRLDDRSRGIRRERLAGFEAWN